MCGIMAEYDTVQNKIKNGYIFKVRYYVKHVPTPVYSETRLLKEMLALLCKQICLKCIGHCFYHVHRWLLITFNQ